jgi:hypothetical protein
MRTNRSRVLRASIDAATAIVGGLTVNRLGGEMPGAELLGRDAKSACSNVSGAGWVYALLILVAAGAGALMTQTARRPSGREHGRQRLSQMSSSERSRTLI